MSGTSEARLRSVRGVLWVVLVLNLAVASAKLLVGWLSASISMIADGFHSLADASSNVIGLVGISWASQPPDEDHPYGHRKIETFAALLIGGLLAMTAWEVLKTAVFRWLEGGAPRVTALSFVVMGGTLLVNLAVSSFEHRAGRRLHSDVLRADAAHTRSDVYVSLGVIASLAAAHFGFPQADVVAAVVITGVIAYAAFGIVQRAAGPLIDTAAVPADRVGEVAVSVSGVVGVHKVRSRLRPGGAHADLHIQVRPDLPIDKAHVIGHLVADRLEEELGFADVVVHVEPPAGHRTNWRPTAGADN
ncbi:MAG: cation diffusion facilitator family transporter [Acidimicrobiia bacterium]|nr:cation diffusion facilitator family transporter [Acidimicrobiia bacterium]